MTQRQYPDSIEEYKNLFRLSSEVIDQYLHLEQTITKARMYIAGICVILLLSGMLMQFVSIIYDSNNLVLINLFVEEYDITIKNLIAYIGLSVSAISAAILSLSTSQTAILFWPIISKQRKMEITNQDLARHFISQSLYKYQKGDYKKAHTKLVKAKRWVNSTNLWHPQVTQNFLLYVNTLLNSENKEQALEDTYQEIIYDIVYYDLEQYMFNIDDSISQIESRETIETATILRIYSDYIMEKVSKDHLKIAVLAGVVIFILIIYQYVDKNLAGLLAALLIVVEIARNMLSTN